MLRKKMLSLALCAALLAPSSIFAANFNQKIIGIGDAVIDGDVETVQTKALEKAKKNAVLTAMNRLLGIQVSENDEMFATNINEIINQFSSFAEITKKTPSREGANLKIELAVNIDEVAFRGLLKDLGVGLNQKTREIGSIVIFFDESEKPYDRPQDMFNEYIEYKRDNSKYAKSSSTASAASTSAISVKDKESASYSDKRAVSAKSSSEASYSGRQAFSGNESAAVSSGGDHAAGSRSVHSASSVNAHAKDSASYEASSSTKAAYSKDLDLKAASSSSKSSSKSSSSTQMDKESFVYKKEYKEIKEAPINSSYVKSELQKNLKQYGLEFIEAPGILAEFNKFNKSNKHPYKSYTEAINSSDSTKFRDFVKTKTKADYMGIAYSQINYSLKADDTTGKFGCTTTQSNVNIFSLKDSKSLDSGSLEAVNQAAKTIELCKDNARFDMAKNLAQSIGLNIQKTIRDATRSFASGFATYKLIIRGSLDRQTRVGFQKMLDSLKTQVKSYKLVSQDEKGITYEVTYSGNKEIGDFLLDTATSAEFSNIKPVFDKYDMKKEAQNTVILYPTK
jgi:hypothetical protein